jgi:hypothetical protein
MAKGRKEKFNLPSKKRALRLPVWLWNKLDAIGEEQVKLAQDVIYDQLNGVEYTPQGNFVGLMQDLQEVIKKHKV